MRNEIHLPPPTSIMSESRSALHVLSCSFAFVRVDYKNLPGHYLRLSSNTQSNKNLHKSISTHTKKKYHAYLHKFHQNTNFDAQKEKRHESFYPALIKGKPSDVNMELVDLANTKISTEMPKNLPG